MYPIVGLFNMATPATPDVKKGSPDIPINKYMSILIAPNVLPRINPASKTVNVCPVIGTGEIGITILICAVNAVRNAKLKDKKRFLNKVPFSTQSIAIFLEGYVSMFIS
jgi:hypothetical protein